MKLASLSLRTVSTSVISLCFTDSRTRLSEHCHHIIGPQLAGTRVLSKPVPEDEAVRYATNQTRYVVVRLAPIISGYPQCWPDFTSAETSHKSVLRMIVHAYHRDESAVYVFVE